MPGFAAAASRITGKVVGPEGGAVSGRRVQLYWPLVGLRKLQSLPAADNDRSSGRYDFRGLVVGSRVEIWVSIDEDQPTGRMNIERQQVRSPDPIELPDVVIPGERAKEGRSRHTL